MKKLEIVVVFHSEKMLQTLDLNLLIQVLMTVYGHDLTLRFRPMSKCERESAEELADGIVTTVRRRFLLKELQPDGQEVRREDLERRMVPEGRDRAPFARRS